MKLLFTADLHGYDRAYSDFAQALKNSFALGVLGGDLMTYPSDEELKLAKRQLESENLEIADLKGANNPHVVERALRNKENYYKRILHNSDKPVLFVMGNDDGILGSGSGWLAENSIVDINQRRAMWGKYSFVGYHYTSPFVGGAFEKSEAEQARDFATLIKFMNDNTVLITHGPPWGILDTTFGGKHAGSKALRDLIEKRPPLVHLFGHIHQSFGIQGIFVNGAYPGSRKFISVDLENRKIAVVEQGSSNHR